MGVPEFFPDGGVASEGVVNVLQGYVHEEAREAGVLVDRGLEARADLVQVLCNVCMSFIITFDMILCIF